MNIVHVSGDSASEFNSSYWRGVIPSSALMRAGHKVFMPHVRQWFDHTADVKTACANADLIIVQRVLVDATYRHAQYWRERKKPLVIDGDDNYSRLDKDSGNQAATFWFEGKVEIKMAGGVSFLRQLDEHPLQQFFRGGSMVTGFTMPSRFLAEELSRYAHCWLIPNYIDSPRYLKAKRKSLPVKPDELVIGWGGSMSHVNSFKYSGVAEALRRVLQKRRNVKLMVCGDERIVPLLPIPREQLIFRHYVQWFDWPSMLAQFDIGIAPLQAEYDASRSAIKATEYSVMGVPFVATGSAPYKDYIENGVGLYVPDSERGDAAMLKRADEWEKLLLEVIDHYGYHKQKIDSQFDYAMTWDVDYNVPNLVRTYEDIIAHG